MKPHGMTAQRLCRLQGGLDSAQEHAYWRSASCNGNQQGEYERTGTPPAALPLGSPGPGSRDEPPEWLELGLHSVQKGTRIELMTERGRNTSD